MIAHGQVYLQTDLGPGDFACDVFSAWSLNHDLS